MNKLVHVRALRKVLECHQIEDRDEFVEFFEATREKADVLDLLLVERLDDASHDSLMVLFYVVRSIRCNWLVR